MKIAIFTDSLLPNIDGVANTYTRFIEFLQQDGHSFKIFSPFKPEKHISWSDHVHLIHSLPFFIYPKYKISIPDKEFLYSELDSFQPDIIHVSSPSYLGQTGLDYARNRQIPAVSVFHTNFSDYLKYYGFAIFENAMWLFLRRFYNQFNLTLVPSTKLLLKLKDLGFENLKLWQRGVDANFFQSQKNNIALRKILSPEDKPILLYVGRLVKEKDLDVLIQMAHILQVRKVDFQLVFVGDGPMGDELRDKLPTAKFTSYLQGEELAQIYASSDIFVFPSTTETFGNVILEANASGLPVVGVNAGGVTDLIENGLNGFLAQPNSPKQMAGLVQLLIENSQLRKQMGSNGIRNVKRFSWQSINNQLLEYYKNLIEKEKINVEIPD